MFPVPVPASPDPISSDSSSSDDSSDEVSAPTDEASALEDATEYVGAVERRGPTPPLRVCADEIAGTGGGRADGLEFCLGAILGGGGLPFREMRALSFATGDPAKLRLDWASRKAATDIRWEESDAKLSTRGRGWGDGNTSSGEGGLRWRKALRLNESGP